MATRLYPNTNNPTTLEQLANVKPGTHAILTAIEQRHQTELEQYRTANPDASWRDIDGIQERHYCEIHDHENCDIEKLYDFMLYGYGRLRYNNFANPDDHAAGSTQQLPLIVGICRAHELPNHTIMTLYRSGGVHWS